MLLTSLVGIPYAAATVQPLDDNSACSPTSSNYIPGDCAAHQGGNTDLGPRQSCVAPGQKGLGLICCFLGNAPNNLGVSDIHTDYTCD